jgi:hypothetical protein
LWFKARPGNKFIKPHLNKELGAVAYLSSQLHGKLKLGGSQFQPSPSKKVHETPQLCREAQIGGSQSRPVQAKKPDHISKINKERAGIEI